MRRAWLSVPLMLACSNARSISPPDAGPPADVLVRMCDGGLNVDKSTVNLGTLDVQGSGAGTVTLTNTSCASSGKLSLTTSEGVVATGCDGSLAGGASCTITVTVTPAGVGMFNGTLGITAYPGAVTPLHISVVAAVAGTPLFDVLPVAVDEGTVPLGIVLPPIVLTVLAGVELTDLNAVAVGPDVAIDPAATTCTPVLLAGASCIVVARFAPLSPGKKSEGIQISASGPAGARVVTAAITATVATGVALAIDPSDAPQSAAPPGQTSAPTTFVVSNRGNRSTGLLSVMVTGYDAADFPIATTCTTLAPLETCTITLVFQPPGGTFGRRVATLEITDTGPSAATIALPLVGTVLLLASP